jgi:ankyrin repeat protein
MASAAGRFPFDTACRDNTALELLRVLVERTPVTVKMTDDGEELPLPLHFACNRQASVEMMVKFLLGIDPDAVKTANSHGNLPLHLVCCNHARSHEPLDVVQFLAKENPAAVKTTNTDGNLPLHLACTAQASLGVVQFLVEMDPDTVEAANNVGFWPLHEACCNDAPLDVVLALVEWSLSAFKQG